MNPSLAPARQSFTEALASALSPVDEDLWHAGCSISQWQARKKLTRDPAAFNPLSVACRYASRPPSDPILSSNLSGTWPQRPGSPAFGANFYHRRVYKSSYPSLHRRPRTTLCRLRATAPRDSAALKELSRVSSTKFVTRRVTFCVQLRLRDRRFRVLDAEDENFFEAFRRPAPRASRTR